MALPPLSPNIFPNVPPFAGVPSLLRNPLVPLVVPQLVPILADVSNIARQLGLLAGPAWGIYDATGKTVVLIGDSVLSVNPKLEVHVSDYAVEDGGFESYNRVIMPGEVVIRVSKGGSISDRTAFLSKIEGMVRSTTLYTIVQPETVLYRMNAVSRDYDRSQLKGATLLSVNIHFEEIRTNAVASFSNTANPGSADPTNSGPVQAQTPTAAQAAALNGAP